MSKEVKRYDCTDGGARFCQGCYTMSECEFGEYVSWDDYDALLAERDRLREALTAMLEIHGVTQSYAETHIEIPQSWVEVSDIARAALQGEQP